MLSLDLFATRYERQLHEGAVDQLEQRRIEDLNHRMDDLMARARNARPEAKAALKQEFEKIKAERDSYYKIRETKIGQDIVNPKQKMKALTPAKPGMAGAVKDVAQGLKNFLQGRPETGPTYEGVVQDALKDYLKVTGESDVEAVRAAIDKIGRDPTLKPTSKRRLIGQIGMMVNKHRIPVGPKYYQYMQRFMESNEWDDADEFGMPGSEFFPDDKDGLSTEAVERAVLNRIMVAHTDLLKQYGPQKVMQAAEEVAYNVGNVDEIGSSDVSGWVKQVEQILGAVQEAKGKPSLRDPKDNPCWKGYHPVGTKQKNGRTVPNCVPKD